MIREIIIWPDTCLKRVSDPVVHFDDDLRTLLNDMAESMVSAKGAGLAAIQLGYPIRAITLLVDGTTGREIVKLCNPVVVESKGVQRGKEGCLSLPGYYDEVRRAAWVKVEGQDENGSRIDIEGSGFLARALLHEIDHLDGKVFADHLSPLKRNLAASKFKRAKADGLRWGSDVPEPKDFTQIPS